MYDENYEILLSRVIELLTRDGWKLSRKARISFRRRGRPFSFPQRMSFLIFFGAPRLHHLTSIGRERYEENHSCFVLSFPTALKGRKALTPFPPRNRSNVNLPCHSVSSDSQRLRRRFNNAWTNHPEPETLATCKILRFPKSFLAPLTHLYESLWYHWASIFWYFRMHFKDNTRRTCPQSSSITHPNFNQIKNCKW